MINDSAAQRYAQVRSAHWDGVAVEASSPSAMQRCYRKYLAKMYTFLAPAGQRVLELGCGKGDLLASLNPAYGLGVDFSAAMVDAARARHGQNGGRLEFVQADAHALETLQEAGHATTPFDVIILSDLFNDLWDLQEVFAQLRPFCSPTTRIVCNFHSQLWEHPFHLFQRLGKVTPRLTQNWFTPEDVENMACLAEFEVVRAMDGFIWPLDTPVLAPLCNRWLARLWPFKHLDIVHFMVLRPRFFPPEPKTVTVVIPARNEAGNIEAALQRTPDMGAGTEIIFVEGNSTDNTWDVIQEMQKAYAHRDVKIMRQPGRGKGDAVRTGFQAATGDILMILDADLTMPPETLPQFYDAIASGKAEFVNGVRLVYPQEKEAMRFCNLVANKLFGLIFSWLLDTTIKDTLCGTKVLSREHYQQLTANRAYFGEFDPFGDFDLIFGAAKLNLKIRDLPVRYRDRTYGDTNISRWRDGMLLLRMVLFAAKRIKFI